MTKTDWNRAIHGVNTPETEFEDTMRELLRLRAAINWMADYDPALVSAAKTKFGFE
jgi:hypothetical protein